MRFSTVFNTLDLNAMFFNQQYYREVVAIVVAVSFNIFNCRSYSLVYMWSISLAQQIMYFSSLRNEKCSNLTYELFEKRIFNYF